MKCNLGAYLDHSLPSVCSVWCMFVNVALVVQYTHVRYPAHKMKIKTTSQCLFYCYSLSARWQNGIRNPDQICAQKWSLASPSKRKTSYLVNYWRIVSPAWRYRGHLSTLRQVNPRFQCTLLTFKICKSGRGGLPNLTLLFATWKHFIY